MRTYSYETILSAVGRVLDLAEARSFSVREVESGIALELTTGETAEHRTLNFDLADLVELMEWASTRQDEPHYERAYAANEGTLRQVLERGSQELVGSTR